MASKLHQQFITRLNQYPRAKLALQLSAAGLIPAIPILYWSNNAKREREEREREVRTRLRIPNVQTIDDLLIEKCQPGDVILFDRRCECCADGAVAALACVLGKAALCNEDDGTRSVERGSYEHCGIVVPGLSNSPAAQHDPSNLCLLEATSGAGIVCRPLLTVSKSNSTLVGNITVQRPNLCTLSPTIQRLEMSRSRSVILLPLSCPGERRFAIDHTDDDTDETNKLSEKTIYLKNQTYTELSKFRDKWLSDSQTQQYQKQHSFLSIMGTFMYLTNLYPTFPIPISPSAWLVVQGLQECGAAMKLNEKQSQETRVEDFTRDGRFFEKDTVRLRPGWKFLSPVVMRETSVR